MQVTNTRMATRKIAGNTSYALERLAKALSTDCDYLQVLPG